MNSLVTLLGLSISSQSGADTGKSRPSRFHLVKTLADCRKIRVSIGRRRGQKTVLFGEKHDSAEGNEAPGRECGKGEIDKDLELISSVVGGSGSVGVDDRPVREKTDSESSD